MPRGLTGLYMAPGIAATRSAPVPPINPSLPGPARVNLLSQPFVDENVMQDDSDNVYSVYDFGNTISVSGDLLSEPPVEKSTELDFNEDVPPADPSIEGMLQVGEDKVDLPEDEFVANIEEQDNLEASLNEMPPPPSRRMSSTFHPSLAEEVVFPRSKAPIEGFEFALGLWCEQASVSRQEYQSLLEVLSLMTDLSQVKRLPRSVTTLKKRVREQLPLMKMQRQEINLIPEKLPTYRTANKGEGFIPKEDLYWFNTINLFTRLLSSKPLVDKMHFGMAHFVDEPSEFWHGHAWGSSIRSCSGDFAHYKDGSAIFPSDIVECLCSFEECECRISEIKHLARVSCVGRNFLSSATSPGSIVLLAQVILPYEAVRPNLEADLIIHTAQNHRSTELFLVEDQVWFLSEEQILKRITDICLDYKFEGKFGSPYRFTGSERYYIRAVANLAGGSVRQLQLSHPPRAELEIAAFGRDYLESHLTSDSISLPFTCFIDGFGLYRNMYRSLMGIYITLASLDVNQRNRRPNVHPITLGPHGSNLDDVIGAMTDIPMLDKGMEIMINGEAKFVCAFVLAYRGDMVQQQNNSGFMSCNANVPCRSCMIKKSERADLDYDIIMKGRTHYRTLQERAQIDRRKGVTDREKRYKALGMKSEQSPLVKMTPALDIIRTRPGDPCHSEFAGIAKQAQGLLFSAILTKPAQSKYTLELQRFPFPPTWARLQSPMFHLQSYRMQESGRLSIISPVLMRCCMQDDWVKPPYLKAARRVMAEEMATGLTAVEAIIFCYAAMARSNTIVLKRTMSQESRHSMTEALKASRRGFQKLFEAASLASAKSAAKKKGSQSPAPSGAASPSPSASGSDAGSDVSLGEVGYLPVQSERGEYDQLAETATVEEEIEDVKKSKLYRAFLSRPNVHQAVHMPDVAFDYATPNNLGTLIDEDKHRDWKAFVTTTNNINVIKTLLTRENVQQTLRFLLNLSYVFDEPVLTEMLHSLRKACPVLLKNALPPSDSELEEKDSSEIPTLADAHHIRPAALNCLSRKYVQEELDLPLWPHRLQINDPFLRLLREAYETEYKQANVVQFPKSILQWCQKFSFTDSKSEHRLTFKINDFVSYTRGERRIGRINNIFVHNLHGTKQRIFAVVDKVNPSTLGKDSVTGLDFLSFSHEEVIIGLPAISSQKLYLIPVEEEVEQRFGARPPVRRRVGSLRRGGDEELLYCNWDIDFL